jgi:hypothetical protein
MFKVVEVKNYDEHHHYGTDWVTDYICETDENITDVNELIEKVKGQNHAPCGECMLKTQEDGKIVLNTRMY